MAGGVGRGLSEPGEMWDTQVLLHLCDAGACAEALEDSSAVLQALARGRVFSSTEVQLPPDVLEAGLVDRALMGLLGAQGRNAEALVLYHELEARLAYERAAFERTLDAVRASLGAGTFDASRTSAKAAPWEQIVDGVAAFGEQLRRHRLGRGLTQEEPVEHAAMAR